MSIASLNPDPGALNVRVDVTTGMNDTPFFTYDAASDDFSLAIARFVEIGTFKYDWILTGLDRDDVRSIALACVALLDAADNLNENIEREPQ